VLPMAQRYFLFWGPT